MTEERRAPVQSDRFGMSAGTISWDEHHKAWSVYSISHSQSAERIAERGGFGYQEISNLLGHEPTTWRRK